MTGFGRGMRQGRGSGALRRRLRWDHLESRETPAMVIDLSSGFAPGQVSGGRLAGYEDRQLLLTDGPYQGPSAWTWTRVDVRAFQTSFVFQQIDPDPSDGRPAGDGLTFALTSSRSFSQVGVPGGGLGYQGLADAVAIKFDLADNAGEGASSVGVYTGGSAPTTPAIALDGTAIDLHSGHPFRADLDYNGVTLTLRLTDTTAPDRTWTHDFAVDVPAALRSSTGYVGFTAGTGELVARQAIHSWTYSEITPAAGLNRPPEITSAARAEADGPTALVLTGGATDDGGADALTYQWLVVSTPGGASAAVSPIDRPGFPAAARVSVDRPGAYTFLLVATDAEGQSATSHVSYLVGPAVTSLYLSPESAVLPAGGTAQFVAAPLNQFGDLMMDAGPVVWEVVNGPGSIGSDGLFSAPTDATGTTTVRATVTGADPVVQAEAEVRVVPAVQTAEAIDFGQGFAGAGLVSNGSAGITDSRLRLASTAYQAGSAFAPEPVDVRGFSTSFRFQVGDEPSWGLGDGLTFVFQNAGPSAVGAAGGGLGYEGIGRSVAVKFDLVDNAGEGSNSTGVYTNGATPTVPADTFVATYPFDSSVHLNSGDRFEVTLSYSGGTLLLHLVNLDRHAREFTKVYAVDIPAAVGGPTAFVGFTAATGELFAPIDILDWTYTPTVNTAGDAAPIVVPPPRATLYFVRDRSVELSALGADDGGEANLTYTWRVVMAPQGAGPVRFSTNGTNAARTATATFDQAGRYILELVISDTQGNSALPVQQPLEVVRTPSVFVVTPAAPTVMNGATVKIQVETLDQFGGPMPFGSGEWRLTDEGPGHINITADEYVAPPAGSGPVTIRASNGSVTGTATVFVMDLPTEAGITMAPGFYPAPGVAYNGSAIQQYPWVRLTEGAPDRAGSVFTTGRLEVAGFTSRFAFRLGGPDFAHNAGAGIAFVIQGVGPAAIGSAGAGLGYEGIGQSAAITFDPAANAIGLATNGSAPAGTVSLAGSGLDLRRGHAMRADLVYDGHLLHLWLTDNATGATIAVPFDVDLPALVGGSTAHVGFTGATGPTVDPYGVQQVMSWHFESVPPGTPNQPPLIVRSARLLTPVSYGPVSLPLSANMEVRAEDDGGPGNLRYRWELVSAPAGSTPQIDASGQTGARFFEPGTYVFRVTVADAQGATAVQETTYRVG